MAKLLAFIFNHSSTLAWNAKALIQYGRVDRASATEAEDLGLIPGRVKPKTRKIGIYSFPA